MKVVVPKHRKVFELFEEYGSDLVPHRRPAKNIVYILLPEDLGGELIRLSLVFTGV